MYSILTTYVSPFEHTNILTNEVVDATSDTPMNDTSIMRPGTCSRPSFDTPPVAGTMLYPVPSLQPSGKTPATKEQVSTLLQGVAPTLKFIGETDSPTIYGLAVYIAQLCTDIRE